MRCAPRGRSDRRRRVARAGSRTAASDGIAPARMRAGPDCGAPASPSLAVTPQQQNRPEHRSGDGRYFGFLVVDLRASVFVVVFLVSAPAFADLSVSAAPLAPARSALRSSSPARSPQAQLLSG